MFSTNGHIVHTIAAPGSEFQALTKISLTGVFARIYNIDEQHTIDGKIRGLVNSFKNTKATEVFRELKVNELGKEKKNRLFTFVGRPRVSKQRERARFFEEKHRNERKKHRKIRKRFPGFNKTHKTTYKGIV